MSSGERLADVRAVETDFEGRVSTKPRETSRAAAGCRGFPGGARSGGQGGVESCGACGEQPPERPRGGVFTSQGSFWVPLLPQTLRMTPSPRLLGPSFAEGRAGLWSGREKLAWGQLRPVFPGLWCSERPRLCGSLGCVCEGRSLDFEGETSLMKCLLDCGTDPSAFGRGEPCGGPGGGLS